MVPWAVLTPEQVERIVGVLIGRKLPRSIRVRPAQGDGGIDVLDPRGTRHADIYQIKSFASALTSNQRRQIKKSLDTVAANPAVDVRDWYLVLPLNPSPPDLEWLAEMEARVSFECHWYGLDRLESLAAAYQDVVDYYVGDVRRRLEEAIERLRALTGFAATSGTSRCICTVAMSVWRSTSGSCSARSAS